MAKAKVTKPRTKYVPPPAGPRPTRQFDLGQTVAVGGEVAKALETTNGVIVGYKWGGDERGGREVWVYTLRPYYGNGRTTAERGNGMTPWIDVYEDQIVDRITI